MGSLIFGRISGSGVDEEKREERALFTTVMKKKKKILPDPPVKLKITGAYGNYTGPIVRGQYFDESIKSYECKGWAKLPGIPETTK